MEISCCTEGGEMLEELGWLMMIGVLRGCLGIEPPAIEGEKEREVQGAGICLYYADVRNSQLKRIRITQQAFPSSCFGKGGLHTLLQFISIWKVCVQGFPEVGPGHRAFLSEESVQFYPVSPNGQGA
jgi:hypothetical protein